MRRICVFAGSNPGARSEYVEVARLLGTALATRGIGLVYGGARIGLMGRVADAVLAAGGTVIGVMPRELFSREMAHAGLTELREVSSMHERKAEMASLADCVVALPGGYGTFEELFEIVSWTQLGIHRKPVGLLNVLGYYEPILTQVNRAVTDGFIPPTDAALMLADDDPVRLLDRLSRYRLPKRVHKWSELSPKI